jgi:hypothetical protein
MVGLEREALELLAKSDERMGVALARATAGQPMDMEYLKHFCHAQCRWLLGPPAPAHDLTRACQLLTSSQDMALADAGEYAQELDWVLSLWLYAGRYAECVAKFEQFVPHYVPTSHDHHSEAAMAYLLARERLQPKTSEPEMNRLLDDFLKQQVPILLEGGRYDQFARWVQIATRAEAGAPARSAVREIAERYA